jgi:hypothetical protein
MNFTSKYTLVICAMMALASTTSAGATTIGVSSFSPQFVGVDLATATILSDADSNVVNTSVAYIERIDLTARGIGFTTTPPSGPLETTSQTTSQFSPSDPRPGRDQRQLLLGRSRHAVARRPNRISGLQRDGCRAPDLWLQ